MDLAEMLRQDRVAWDELVSVLDAHSTGVIHSADSAWPWTSSDIYAHLSRWTNYSMDTLEAKLGVRTSPKKLDGTEDEINRRWQRADSSLSYAEARDRAHMAFDRRIRLLESIRDDAWDAALEKIARYDGAEHYRAHLRYIVVR